MRELLIQKAEQNPYFDVAIIGGTWCGLSLALEFAAAGRRCILLEKEDFESKEQSPYLFIPPHDALTAFSDYCKRKLPSFAPISVDAYFPIESWKHGLELLLWSTRKKLLSHVRGTESFSRPIWKEEGTKSLHERGSLIDYSALTWAFLKHNIEQGQTPLNHVEVKKITHQQGKVRGLELFDRFMGRSFRIFTPMIINLSPSFHDPFLKGRTLLQKKSQLKGWIVPSETQTKPTAFLKKSAVVWNADRCSFKGPDTPIPTKGLRVDSSCYIHFSKAPYILEEKVAGVIDLFLFELASLPDAISAMVKKCSLYPNPLTIKKLRIPDPSEYDPALFAIRYQMARSVEDVLMRRYPLSYISPQEALEKAPLIALLFKQEFGKLLDWQEKAIASFRTMMKTRMV